MTATATGAEPGMGAAQDAVTSFLQVAGGAARDLATEKAGDPRVSSAFSLGWQMAELYRVVMERLHPAQPVEPALATMAGAVAAGGAAPASPGTGATPASPGTGAAPASPGTAAAASSNGTTHATNGASASTDGGSEASVGTSGVLAGMPNLPASRRDLPGIARMTREQRDAGAQMQVNAALARLAATVTAAGLKLPSQERLSGCVNGEDHVRESNLRTLHVELFSTLTAADVRLGKAYGLGRALSDTCRSPRDHDELTRRFKPSRIARLRNELDDLATAFPPHAANAVNRALCRWSETLWPAETPAAPARRRPHRPGRLRARAAPPELPAERELLTCARRQGQMWRALLSGEKNGEDMLRPSDYVRAAGQALDEVRDLTRQLVRSFPLVATLVVLLFVGGIALMVGATSSGSTLAGAAGVLASAGITWKGIGSSAGGIAARVEQRLWGSELDGAIADATFLLSTDNPTSRQRRKLAMQAAEYTRELAAELTGGSSPAGSA